MDAISLLPKYVTTSLCCPGDNCPVSKNNIFEVEIFEVFPTKKVIDSWSSIVKVASAGIASGLAEPNKEMEVPKY